MKGTLLLRKYPDFT